MHLSTNTLYTVCVARCAPAERATHTHNRLEYAAIALSTKHINKYTGTMPVILAR